MPLSLGKLLVTFGDGDFHIRDLALQFLGRQSAKGAVERISAAFAFLRFLSGRGWLGLSFWWGLGLINQLLSPGGIISGEIDDGGWGENQEPLGDLIEKVTVVTDAED